MSKLDPGHLYDEPLSVTTCGDAVVILGPDAVAVSITADAAERSARALATAAEEVRARMSGQEGG
jgi:hypothetical protein